MAAPTIPPPAIARTRAVRRAFQGHKDTATQRGIPFLLTFEEWWEIWQQSGHWHQRGRKRGQYCMARCGDRGAYEASNVRIVTIAQNHAEWRLSQPRIIRKPRTEEEHRQYLLRWFSGFRIRWLAQRLGG